MRHILLVGALVFIAGGASAQEMSRFTFEAGAGFTTPVYNTGHNVDYGWNVGAGFGVNIVPYLGVKIDASYNSMGVNSATLTNLGYGGGNLNVFSATLDPVVHLNPKGHVDVYLIGGGGLYHRTQDFTQPGVLVGTGFNPFFGFFPTAVGVNQVVSSYTVNKPGVDGGVGIAFGRMWHGKFFAEARFNRIFMGHNQTTDYVPVTFGFRW